MVKNANIEFSIDQAVLDLKAPINNPTFTGTVSVTGTLSCPHLPPQISHNNFDTIKTPGLYHYDGGLSNPPSSSQIFRSIEIGREGRYSQIAMPWDSDRMFFRRQESNAQGFFTPWREIVHSGNINTFTQMGHTLAALALKAPVGNPTCTETVGRISKQMVQ